MGRYSLAILPSAQRGIDKLPAKEQEKIIAAIGNLADDPRPHGCKKLKVFGNYRIRVGDYRVIYDIHDKTVTVEVLKVGHRSNIYTRLT